MNRLEFGKKFCPDSPTMKEEGLHQAILEAVNSLSQGRADEMVSCLQETLVSSTAGKFDVHAIQRQLDEKGQEFDRLLCLTGEEESKFLDRKIKKFSDEMAKLREQKEQAEKWIEQNKIKALEMESIMKRISEEPLDLTEYSDSLTYRIIERIAVISKEEIQIQFVGGYEIKQYLK